MYICSDVETLIFDRFTPSIHDPHVFISLVLTASKYSTDLIGPAKYNVRYRNLGEGGPKYSMAHKQPQDIITGPPNSMVQPVDTHGRSEKISQHQLYVPLSVQTQEFNHNRKCSLLYFHYINQ